MSLYLYRPETAEALGNSGISCCFYTKLFYSRQSPHKRQTIDHRDQSAIDYRARSHLGLGPAFLRDPLAGFGRVCIGSFQGGPSSNEGKLPLPV